MWYVDDPLAAGELAAVVAVLELAGADEEAGVDEEPGVLHPTMSAAIAAITTPPEAMRARLSNAMVLTAPSTERPLARQYIGVLLGERSSNITI
jgi:hypothetical protein